MSDHAGPPCRRNAASAALNRIMPDGLLHLQRCTDCGAVQSPPRELCGNCLATELQWHSLPGDGTIIAVTSIHHSLEEFFRARLPWRIASVHLDAGPVVFAHLAPGDADAGQRVQVATARDRSGAWCLVTLAAHATRNRQGVIETLVSLGLHNDDDQQ